MFMPIVTAPNFLKNCRYVCEPGKVVAGGLKDLLGVAERVRCGLHVGGGNHPGKSVAGQGVKRQFAVHKHGEQIRIAVFLPWFSSVIEVRTRPPVSFETAAHISVRRF